MFSKNILLKALIIIKSQLSWLNHSIWNILMHNDIGCHGWMHSQLVYISATKDERKKWLISRNNLFNMQVVVRNTNKINFIPNTHTHKGLVWSWRYEVVLSPTMMGAIPIMFNLCRYMYKIYLSILSLWKCHFPVETSWVESHISQDPLALRVPRRSHIVRTTCAVSFGTFPVMQYKIMIITYIIQLISSHNQLMSSFYQLIQKFWMSWMWAGVLVLHWMSICFLVYHLLLSIITLYLCNLIFLNLTELNWVVKL